MPKIHEKPLRVFARLDGDTDPTWWLTAGDGWFVEWAPEPRRVNESRRRVQTDRLRIPRVDSANYLGDNEAILMVHNAGN